MKASELITALQDAVSVHGDQLVIVAFEGTGLQVEPLVVLDENDGKVFLLCDH
jgi:hypothetical protein